MKVLVIGNGGREHALCDKLLSSKTKTTVFAYPGNSLWDNVTNVSCKNYNELVKFVKNQKIDFTIVGPEDPLANGIVDKFIKNDLLILGPDKKSARLESSKSFSKKIMDELKIPTAEYKIFKSLEPSLKYLKSKNEYPIVLKSSNLAAGKGVKIVNSFEEASKYLKEIFIDKIYGDKNSMVIEEFMDGFEYSLMCLIDGVNVYALPVARDHKRIFDNDEGPNTGGMGVVTNLDSHLSKKDIDEAIKKCIIPINNYVKKEKLYYKGILFAGIMKCKNGKQKVIEYNVRFGDPETETVLEKIDNDFSKMLLDFLKGKKIKLEINNLNVMSVVISAKGYPGKYLKDIDISDLQKVNMKKYYMGATEKNNKIFSTGGRIAIFVNSSNENKNRLFEETYNIINSNIKNKDLFYRKDIGKKI